MSVSSSPSAPHGGLTFHWLDQHLTLLPEKAIYWKEQKALVVADLHLGKAGHFRKAGVPITSSLHWEDLSTLSLAIEAWQPQQVFILGDLFHSDLNREWDYFEKWLSQHQYISFYLVKGNHDILPSSIYDFSQLQLVDSPHHVGPFSLTHEPTPDTQRYNLAGHLHPSVTLHGLGKQRMRVPCYFFGKSGAVLPAFGKFTGTARITATPTDHIFGITQDRVIRLN